MRFSFLLGALLPLLASASELVLQSPRFTILSSDGITVRSEEISSNALPNPALSVGSTDTLRVTFTVADKSLKGVQPHQTFIRFFDPRTEEEGIHPIRVASNGKAKFDLNMAKNPIWLPPTTDLPVEVSLIVGSFKYDPLHLPLFRVTLPRSQPAPINAEEKHYHVQPEIQHTFRAKEKIPAKAISGVFALLTLSPWFVLLGMWLQIPHHTPKLFSSQILPFVTLLAILEAFLVYYWVGLQLPELLTYGSVLSLITAATGKRALSAISKWRHHQHH